MKKAKLVIVQANGSISAKSVTLFAENTTFACVPMEDSNGRPGHIGEWISKSPPRLRNGKLSVSTAYYVKGKTHYDET